MLSSEWRAMQNEAQLAAEQIAQGVTLLGKACYSQPGRYLQAFFCLSIGFERAGKIVFIADHAIQNNGVFPTDEDFRRYGHDLNSLLQHAEVVSRNLDPNRTFPERPTDKIHQGIEEVVAQFATKLRYYNLDHLSGQSKNKASPITLWWDKVATPICKRHYSLKQQRKNANLADIAERVLGESTHIMHETETGEELDSIYKCFSHSCATNVVQKYGQFYTLQIARWITSIIRELSSIGAYDFRIEALLGVEEPFNIYFNDDNTLRRRRTWSIFTP